MLKKTTVLSLSTDGMFCLLISTSLKHDGTVKMASPIDGTGRLQMGHADRTLKIARLPVPSGTGRPDNGKGPFSVL